MTLNKTTLFKDLLYLVNIKDNFQKTAGKSQEMYTHALLYVYFN